MKAISRKPEHFFGLFIKLFLIVISFTITQSWASSSQEFSEPFKINEPEILNKYQSLYKNRTSGAEYDPASGSVTFAVTDVSIPGNSGLPVDFRRWLAADDIRAGGFVGAWQVDIPVIKGNYIAASSSGVNGTLNDTGENGWRYGKHCTGAEAKELRVQNRELSHGIPAYTYWSGKQLHIPGKTTEKFLVQPNGTQVTKSNYKVISCTNIGGNEGFIVKGPDGVKYTFNNIISYKTGAPKPTFNSIAYTVTRLIRVTQVEDRFGNTVTYNYNSSNNLSSIVGSDDRRIDIEYESYSVGNATKYRISKVKANNKTWQYKYALGSMQAMSFEYLKKVVLPDNTEWQYDIYLHKLDFDGTFSNYRTSNFTDNGRNDTGYCAISSSVSTVNSNAYPFTTQVKSPDGLTIKYNFEVKYHGRSQVNPEIYTQTLQGAYGGGVTKLARNLNCNASFSLVKKTLLGQGLAAQNWYYNYSENYGTYTVPAYNQSDETSLELLNDAPSTVPNTIDFRTTSITGPETKTVYYVDRKFQSPTEGKILAEDHLDKSINTLLKRLEFSYKKEDYVGEFWFVNSTEFSAPTRNSLNANQLQYRINKSKIRTKIYYSDGTDIFDTEYSDYDVMGFSGLTKESNNLSGSLAVKRYTEQEYLHNITAYSSLSANKWVWGLPTRTRLSTNGSSYTTTDEITYHNTSTNSTYYNWLLPYQYKSYGTWVRQYPQYHTSGDARGKLKKIEYNTYLKKASGTDNTSKYRYQIWDDYKRGQAQTITTAQRYNDTGTMSFSREINNDGWITKITDTNGNSADYTYNSVGLLETVDMPGNWADTFIAWSYNANEPITRKAYRCTLNSAKSNCNSGSIKLRTTSEYDALYRILKTGERDYFDSTVVYQNAAYNTKHQPLFSSVRSTTSSETDGISNTYDNLGRVLSTTTSNGGTVSTRYLKGNKVEVTDAQNNVTTTQYLAYGAPSNEKATNISSEEGVTTTLNYNTYGNIYSITQSGKRGNNNISLTEYRAYDARQHLCQIKRSDVGTTVLKNNVLGEVLWQAQGQYASSNTSCNTTAAAADKVSFTYDNLGAQRTISYGDGTPTSTFTLDNNGNVRSIVGGAFSQAYNYNALDMLESESLTLDNKTFTLGYSYSPLGHINTITYPDGVAPVSFNPNGFGQATQAIRSYADSSTDEFVKAGASYHPNGTIDSFTYGNNLVHTTTLNTRQLPQQITDVLGSTDVINLSYGYDNNNNVTSITNPRESGIYSLTDLTYDGLDRLTGTTGGYGIGSSTISYDGLGNISTYSNTSSFNSHSFTYNYNSSNRLTSVSGLGKSYGYDTRGNVTSNSSRSFVYNLANQMVRSGNSQFVYDGYNRRVKSIKDNGDVEYSMYSQSGKLLYRKTAEGGINYIFLGDKLVAKEGTGISSSGDSIMNYKPFGESIEEPKDDVGYTGHKFDTDLGLSYMQARYYDPVIGRFYSNDPVGFYNIHNFNRYSYAYNNPYKYIDPDGRDAGDPFDKIEDAARDFGKTHNQDSIDRDKELGSSIYEYTDDNGDTKYSYNEPSEGTKTGVNPNTEVGEGQTIVSTVHSHAAYKRPSDNAPSDDSDYKTLLGDGPEYVTTPNGSLVEYDNGKKAGVQYGFMVISQGLPSDKNDPTSKK